MNLLFGSSFPEDCFDDGHLCEARALQAAAGHRVRDIGLRNLPEVPALPQERDRLCLRHALLLWLELSLLIAAVYHKVQASLLRCVQRPHFSCMQPVVYM